jgi:hypothetical protein
MPTFFMSRYGSFFPFDEKTATRFLNPDKPRHSVIRTRDGLWLYAWRDEPRQEVTLWIALRWFQAIGSYARLDRPLTEVYHGSPPELLKDMEAAHPREKRDALVYRLAQDVSLAFIEILEQVDGKSRTGGWPKIRNFRVARQIAERYARKHGLEEPPARPRGRPKKCHQR